MMPDEQYVHPAIICYVGVAINYLSCYNKNGSFIEMGGSAVDCLIELVQNFRNSIEEAKEQGEFNGDCRFRNFPTGCCGITTDLLAKFLLDNRVRIKMDYVCGTYYDIDLENPSHAWLELENGHIIDITGDQFKHYPVPLKFEKPVYIGIYSEFHKAFEINLKESYSMQYELDNIKPRNYLSRTELYRIILSHM